METTLVCPFFLIILQMVPRQGAMKGIQNLTMTRSGLSFLISLPTLNQFTGLIELTLALMEMILGSRFGRILCFPGKRIEGYCRLKV